MKGMLIFMWLRELGLTCEIHGRLSQCKHHQAVSCFFRVSGCDTTSPAARGQGFLTTPHTQLGLAYVNVWGWGEGRAVEGQQSPYPVSEAQRKSMASTQGYLCADTGV